MVYSPNKTFESITFQETCHMPAANHVRSITQLMDCFIDEYRSGKLPEGITDLDLRAQVEVIKSNPPSIPMLVCVG